MGIVKKTKKIPVSVDVPGRMVSWKPSASSNRLYGIVDRVFLTMKKHPKDPSLRKLYKHLVIELMDGRKITVSGEHEDLKKLGIVAETIEQTH